MARNTTGLLRGGPGRPKGVPNGITKEVREAFQQVFRSQIKNVNAWFRETSESKPEKALELLLSLGEYFVPKLSRTEITGEDGEKLAVSIVINGVVKGEE